MVSQPDETKDKGKNQESDKKKRDWIDLLAIPIVLALVGAGLSWLNNAFQQKLADNRQRDAVVTQYIQNMKELLLDKDRPLRESKENDVSRDVARIFTTTTLQQLTSDEDKNGQNKQKASVLLFLSLSNLIKKECSLNGFLKGKVKEKCGKEKFRLESPIVMLGSAALGDMDFSGADLKEGYLNEANLSNVNLSNANLTGAYLNMANLTATRLDNANLKNAQLINANLFQAYLFNAKNLTNEQIKSACNWQEAIYTEADENLKPRLEPKDQQANQRRIAEIKNDKASDPPTPVDCSQ